MSKASKQATSHPVAPVTEVTPEESALIEEACRKSSLVWVGREDQAARPLWHVWHDGCVVVVHGGPEQPAPALQPLASGSTTRMPSETVLVSARSKDNTALLVTWLAQIEDLLPHSPAWTSAVAVLAAERLNAPDTAALPQVWAEHCAVTRLKPMAVNEIPGRYNDGSRAARPLPTPASTLHEKPAILHRRPRRSPTL